MRLKLSSAPLKQYFQIQTQWLLITMPYDKCCIISHWMTVPKKNVTRSGLSDPPALIVPKPNTALLFCFLKSFNNQLPSNTALLFCFLKSFNNQLPSKSWVPLPPFHLPLIFHEFGDANDFEILKRFLKKKIKIKKPFLKKDLKKQKINKQKKKQNKKTKQKKTNKQKQNHTPPKKKRFKKGCQQVITMTHINSSSLSYK